MRRRLSLLCGMSLAFQLTLSCAVMGNPNSLTQVAPTDAEKSTKADQILQKPEEKESWWGRTADPTAVFTLGLVLVGIAQLVLFYRQLKLIRLSLIDAKTAADAAKKSADATKTQADVARDNQIKLERPYIFIYNLSPFQKDNETGEYYVTYSVANFGKIPAIIDGAWIGFAWSDQGEPDVPTLLNEDHSLLRSPILAAGERRDNLAEFLPAGLSEGSAGIIVSLIGGQERDIPKLNLAQNLQLFFRAIIRYHGPFTEDHVTEAEWLNICVSTGEFALRGGAKYNYNR